MNTKTQNNRDFRLQASPFYFNLQMGMPSQDENGIVFHSLKWLEHMIPQSRDLMSGDGSRLQGQLSYISKESQASPESDQFQSGPRRGNGSELISLTDIQIHVYYRRKHCATIL